VTSTINLATEKTTYRCDGPDCDEQATPETGSEGWVVWEDTGGPHHFCPRCKQQRQQQHQQWHSLTPDERNKRQRDLRHAEAEAARNGTLPF
jgi:hypothetical protein